MSISVEGDQSDHLGQLFLHTEKAVPTLWVTDKCPHLKHNTS